MVGAGTVGGERRHWMVVGISAWWWRSAGRFLDGGRYRWRFAGGVRWVTSPIVALGAESDGDGWRRKIEGRERDEGGEGK
jgi:hypothetical protein